MTQTSNPASTPVADSAAETAPATPPVVVAPQVSDPSAAAPVAAAASAPRKKAAPAKPALREVAAKVQSSETGVHPHITHFSHMTAAVLLFCVVLSAAIFYWNAPAELLQSALLSATGAGSVTASAAETTLLTTVLFLIGASLTSIFLLGTSFKWLHFHLGHGLTSGTTGEDGKRKLKQIAWHPAEVLESLTFLWVFSVLLFSLYSIYISFSHTEGGILHFIFEQASGTSAQSATQLSEANLQILLRLAFYCGLLGGTLANLRFFLNARFENNPFKLDYIYRYIASPFIGVAASFFAFLMLIALPYQDLGTALVSVHPLSYIFLFCLAGYFSNSFFLMLGTIANGIEDFVSASTRLSELQKIKDQSDASQK